MIQFEEEDYRVFFLNMYSNVARHVICEVRDMFKLCCAHKVNNSINVFTVFAACCQLISLSAKTIRMYLVN